MLIALNADRSIKTTVVGGTHKPNITPKQKPSKILKKHNLPKGECYWISKGLANGGGSDRSSREDAFEENRSYCSKFIDTSTEPLSKFLIHQLMICTARFPSVKTELARHVAEQRHAAHVQITPG